MHTPRRRSGGARPCVGYRRLGWRIVVGSTATRDLFALVLDQIADLGLGLFLDLGIAQQSLVAKILDRRDVAGEVPPAWLLAQTLALQVGIRRLDVLRERPD